VAAGLGSRTTFAALALTPGLVGWGCRRHGRPAEPVQSEIRLNRVADPLV
jgi:hypothetical protein